MVQRPCCAGGARNRNGCCFRRGRHSRQYNGPLGSLMRHFLAPARSVPMLPRCVSVPPVTGGLVPRASGSQRGAPCHRAACLAAVHLAAVAVAAQEKHLPAGCPAARDEAQRIHQPPGAPLAGLAPGSALRDSPTSHPHAFTRARSPRGPPSVCWTALCLLRARACRRIAVPTGSPQVLQLPRTPSTAQTRTPCSLHRFATSATTTT